MGRRRPRASAIQRSAVARSVPVRSMTMAVRTLPTAASSAALIGTRGARAQAAAFDRGVLTRAPGDTLILAPPFVSTEHDIQRMADRLRQAIEDTSSPT